MARPPAWLDTNVVARLLVGDDPRQTAQAMALLEGRHCFADAVHAYQRPEDESLFSFDRQFVRRAAKAGVRGMRMPA